MTVKKYSKFMRCVRTTDTHNHQLYINQDAPVIIISPGVN